MNLPDAINLIRAAVPEQGGRWADLGAGEGTFTRALATLLGPSGTVFAVDRDPDALGTLRSLSRPDRQEQHPSQAAIIPVGADFSDALQIPGVTSESLDGILLANALHFIRNPAHVLRHLAGFVRRAGSIVVIEYDRRAPDRWVPYPLPPDRLAQVARSAGLGPPAIIATRPSAYAGTLYAAMVSRSSQEGVLSDS